MRSSLQVAPQADLDTFFSDPVNVDPEAPPFFTQFAVDSGGSKIPVKMWLAGGPGKKGTVIVSPPLGGSDSMNSVAVPLMYAGIHVISYRPRGVRDPKNVYSMPKQIDDIHAVIEWIVANSGAERAVPFGPTLRLDPTRIALFGMSGGGACNSYAACAESKYANYAIGVSAANPDVQLTPAKIDKMRPLYAEVKKATHGRSDWLTWLLNMTPQERNRISILWQAPRLVSKHLFLLGGFDDTLTPIDICFLPIRKALREAGVKDLTALVLESDHGFTTVRYRLSRLMIAWLRDRGF